MSIPQTLISSKTDSWYNYPKLYERFAYAEDPENKALNYIVHSVKNMHIKNPIDLATGTGRVITNLINKIDYSGVFFANDINEKMSAYTKSKLNSLTSKKFKIITAPTADLDKVIKEKSNLIISYFGFPSRGTDRESFEQELQAIYKTLSDDGIFYNVSWGSSDKELNNLWKNLVPEKFDPFMNNFSTEKLVDSELRFKSVPEAAEIMSVLMGKEMSDYIYETSKTKWILSLAIHKFTKEQIKNLINKPSIILKSTKYVVERAKDVSIDIEAVNKFAKTFKAAHASHWLKEAPLDFDQLLEFDRIHLTLIFNTISFSYWGTPKWNVDINGKLIDGSWGLISALDRALQEGKPITNPDYLENLTENELQNILRGNTIIPLLKERLKILNEIGLVLNKKFKGDFRNLIKEADGDALKLRDLIIKNFKSFEDISKYKGKTVYFYKRTQVLASDISQMYENTSNKFKNVDQLTAATDYKLPQILRRVGILKYSEKLSSQIDSKIPIRHNSSEEIEIRACTIWAVEYIAQALKKKGVKITPMQINDRLWILTQTHNSFDKPYHLTRTTAY